MNNSMNNNIINNNNMNNNPNNNLQNIQQPQMQQQLQQQPQQQQLPTEPNNEANNTNTNINTNPNTNTNTNTNHTNDGGTANDNTAGADDNTFNDEMDQNAQPHLPLQYAWTLWHTAPAQGSGGVQGWSKDYKQIAQFSTVEEFWRLFNNISPPSLLDAGSSYHLFKGKVRPAWEDAFNKNGGSWAFRFSNFDTGNRDQRGGQYNNQRGGKRGGRGGRGGHGGHGGGRYQNNNNKQANVSHAINYAWYNTVLNMIGNNFTHSEDICGLLINIKKFGKGKIELWIRDSDENKAIEIGQQFKDFSFSGPSKKASTEIEFRSFDDQCNKNRTNRLKL